jgi:hypothetical protein
VTVLTAYTEQAVVTVTQTKPNVSIQMPEQPVAWVGARGSGQSKKGRQRAQGRHVVPRRCLRRKGSPSRQPFLFPAVGQRHGSRISRDRRDERGGLCLYLPAHARTVAAYLQRTFRPSCPPTRFFLSSLIFKLYLIIHLIKK